MMKKGMALLTGMALLIQVSAGIANAQDLPRVRKVEVNAFHSIRVDAAVQVVLADDVKTGPVYIEGDMTQAAQLQVQVVNGELRIGAAAEADLSRIVVSIPVVSLRQLNIQEKANVVSVNRIQSDSLRISAVQGSRVSVESSGPVYYSTISKQ